MPSTSHFSLEPGGGGEHPMTAPGSSSSSSSSVQEEGELSSVKPLRLVSQHIQLPQYPITSSWLAGAPTLSSLPPTPGMSAKFGLSAGNASTQWPNHGSNHNHQHQQSSARAMAGGPMSYLLHANTPPLAANSILFSPAGLPPRHQPTLDYTLPSSVDYFTLVSPSGTMQTLPQQQQQQQQQRPHSDHVPAYSPSYPSMIRPTDTLLGPSSIGPSMRPKLSHLAPLPMQSNPNHHYLHQQQQQGWTGPFSHPIPAQPSNLSASMTAASPNLNGGQFDTHSHNRGLSTSSSSFTSSSSLSMDSLTWSPVGSPTSTSYSQASSFQPSDDFMAQNAIDRVPSPHPPPPRLPHLQSTTREPPSYTYGHPQDSHSKGPYLNNIFDGRQRQGEDRPYSQDGQYYRQSPEQMQSLEQRYLQQPADNTNIRDSVSPVLMSLSPPQLVDDVSLQLPSSQEQQGGMGGVTPTRSNFNLIAPTARLPSAMRKAVEALDAEVGPLMSSSPSSSDEEEDDDEDEADQTAYEPHDQREGKRQLRRGRSNGNQIPLSSMPRYSTTTASNTHHVLATLPSMQPPLIVLPSKIKALGTLPADEAFSASLEQLEDVPHGTKPPYLWWTLIRAAILGAPGQKLQMETLTHLISQKYPYFGSAKEAKNWKSSIRSVIHTKPCFYKSEDENGHVWWHVDPDIDPREQRRGMKKRGSVSYGSGSSDAASLGATTLPADIAPLVITKTQGKLHQRDEDEDEVQAEGVNGEPDSAYVPETPSRKRRRSD